MEIVPTQILPKYDFSDPAVLANELDETVNGDYQNFLRDETEELRARFLAPFIYDPALVEYEEFFGASSNLVRNTLELIWYQRHLWEDINKEVLESNMKLGDLEGPWWKRGHVIFWNLFIHGKFKDRKDFLRQSAKALYQVYSIWRKEWEDKNKEVLELRMILNDQGVPWWKRVQVIFLSLFPYRIVKDMINSWKQLVKGLCQRYSIWKKESTAVDVRLQKVEHLYWSVFYGDSEDVIFTRLQLLLLVRQREAIVNDATDFECHTLMRKLENWKWKLNRFLWDIKTLIGKIDIRLVFCRFFTVVVPGLIFLRGVKNYYDLSTSTHLTLIRLLAICFCVWVLKSMDVRFVSKRQNQNM